MSLLEHHLEPVSMAPPPLVTALEANLTVKLMQKPSDIPDIQRKFGFTTGAYACQ